MFVQTAGVNHSTVPLLYVASASQSERYRLWTWSATSCGWWMVRGQDWI